MNEQQAFIKDIAQDTGEELYCEECGTLYADKHAIEAGKITESEGKQLFMCALCVFRETNFIYSITYQIVTEESAKEGDIDRHGYEIEKEVATLSEILNTAEEHGIAGWGSSAYADWWESPDADSNHLMYHGEWKTYHLHLLNADKSELTKFQWAKINELLRW